MAITRHAVVVGPNMVGRIPVNHPDIPDGFVDISPDHLYFDVDDATGEVHIRGVKDNVETHMRTIKSTTHTTLTLPNGKEHRVPEVALHIVDAIEDEHYVRGSHPLELACRSLDDPSEYPPEKLTPELIAQHKADHQALHAKMAARGVSK